MRKTDDFDAAGAFALTRIRSSLDAAEARLDALAGQLDSNVETSLRRRIADVRRELDQLSDKKFRLTSAEIAPFWRHLLESAEFDPPVGA